MNQQKCRLCGERHRLGPCPQPHEREADMPSAAPKPKKRIKPRDWPEGYAPTHTTPHTFAPPGQCPHCDYRRAKVAEAVRAHRQRKAGKT